MLAPANLALRVRKRVRRAATRIRHRLGLQTLAVGAVRLSERFRHPIDVTRKTALIACYRQHFPAAVEAELQEAGRLLEHRFSVLGHAMRHDAAIAWSRDPVSGRDWSRGFSPDIAYRGADRLGDIKLPWELNKHQYFFTLGKAGWLTDDPKFAREIVSQIDHWIDDNPCHRGIHWISALEAGTRALSWILAYPFYAEACDHAFRERLLLSLGQHLLFAERNLSTGSFANTHLVGEAAALAVGGLFLDCRHSRRWLNTGLRHLHDELGRQLRADGVHVEQSVAYHRFFLDQYYLVDAMLEANGLSPPSGSRAALQRMTGFIMDVLYPDGTAPAFGDGDDARGIWCRADCPRDYRSLLALGAVRFRRGDFKAAARGPAEELLWLQGEQGVETFLALPGKLPTHTSAAYADAGYYAMRSGWEAADPVLVFDCGPLGYGPAGHGHADALSFQLYARGYPFFVDPGTYSYNLDYAWRDSFRSTRAHNTVVVDGLDQSAMLDRMAWKTRANAYCRRLISTPWLDLVDGEHDGYERLSDPVAHRRLVVFLKPDIWLIWDRLTSHRQHDLEWLFHLPADCDCQIRNGSDFLLASPSGAQLKMWMRSDAGEHVQAGILCGSETERASWLSPEYGIKLAARTISVRHDLRGQQGMLTCLSTSRSLVPALLSQQQDVLCVELADDAGSGDIFIYRPGGSTRDMRQNAGEIGFDGCVLYHRRPGSGSGHFVLGRDFRELSVAGVLDVRSAAPIKSLVLNANRCEIEMVAEAARDLHLMAPVGAICTVNGQKVEYKTLR